VGKGWRCEMPGASKLTKVMMVRLPVAAARKVEGKARAKGIGVSELLRGIVLRDVDRKR